MIADFSFSWLLLFRVADPPVFWRVGDFDFAIFFLAHKRARDSPFLCGYRTRASTPTNCNHREKAKPSALRNPGGIGHPEVQNHLKAFAMGVDNFI
jgi:hypothetical protein